MHQEPDRIIDVEIIDVEESTGGSALELEAKQMAPLGQANETQDLDVDESTGGSALASDEEAFDVQVSVLSSERDRTPSSQSPLASGSQPSLFDSMMTLVNGFGQMATNTAMHNGRSALQTLTEVSESLNRTANHTSRMMMVTTEEISGMVSNTALQTSRTATTTVALLETLFNQTAAQTGQMLESTARSIGESALRQLHDWLEQTTQTTGQALNFLGDQPLVRRVSGVLKLDWLVGIADRIDLTKAETAVRQLQQQYPHESPNQIAHRLMVEKAIYASGMGFVSGILPGAAAALLAVDLAATTALQTEMVYQIAAAYGLDLKEAARKGEVLAIFGLALGGRQALRAGFGFLRNIPLAGAMIGASTNAAMLYSLGYAACRFYEAKLEGNQVEPSESKLAEIQAASEQYLQVAIAQQAIMDQVLVHMILASYPSKSWEEIVPALRRMQISEASLETIAANLQAPQPIGPLLEQLNHDFAVPLMAQCYRIAQVNGTISTEEAQILEAIADRAQIKPEEIREITTVR